MTDIDEKLQLIILGLSDPDGGIADLDMEQAIDQIKAVTGDWFYDRFKAELDSQRETALGREWVMKAARRASGLSDE